LFDQKSFFSDEVKLKQKYLLTFYWGFSGLGELWPEWILMYLGMIRILGFLGLDGK